MKNLLKVLSLLAFAALVVVSCKKKEEPNPPVTVEDGYYVVGPQLYLDTLKKAALMEEGLIDQFPDPSVKREGLFVKTVYVDVTKQGGFYIKQVAGGKITKWGGQLEVVDTGIFWRGTLTKDVPITLAESGYYMVLVDKQTNKFGVVKVVPGVCGNMAESNWGVNLPMQLVQNESDNSKATWIIEGVELKAGREFKFRLNNIWNVELDPSFSRVQTNLGLNHINNTTNLLYGGNNIKAGSDPISDYGIYTVKLMWTYDGGYSAVYTKTGDVQLTDWTNTKIELVGSGIAADNPGAIQDNIWNWNVYLYAMGGTEPGLPYEVTTAKVYKWKWTNVHLLANQGFKVRAHEENAFDAGYSIVDTQNSTPNVINEGGFGNIAVTEEGNYDLYLEIDAMNADAKKLVIVPHTKK